MRRITQMMLTLALFFAGVVTVSAKTLEVNLSSLPEGSENTTWAWNAGSSTGTFTWTATSYNSTELFGAGNYSAYTTLNLVTEAGTADHFRIIVKFTNGTGQLTINPVAVGSVSLKLADYISVENLAAVSTIRLSGANDCTGDISVSSIYLEGPDINYIEAFEVYEAPTGTTDLNDLKGTNTYWSVNLPVDLNGQAAGLCGDGDGSNEASHVSIEGYDYLCLYIPSVSGGASDLRIWIWDDVNGRVVTLRPHPIAEYQDVANWEEAYSISTPGTYVAKVTGYKYLKGMKTNWGSSALLTVAAGYMSTGEPVEYLPSGKYTLVGESTGSVSLNAALADTKATCFDANGVTGTGLTLEAANPNALFIANEGTLTNDKNVIIDGTCATLVLTDGFAFKAPVDFTATEASYTTTINAEAGAGTLCLPFDAALPEGVVAYDLNYTAGDAYATKTPVNAITANAPVLINGTGDATFTGAGEVKAGAENINGALTGIFAEGNVPTGSYVLQNGEKGLGFYLVDEEAPITIKPFRAYLTADGAEVRSLGIVLGGETTAIKSVTEAEGEGAIYSLSGVRISQPTRGIYVKNGKKVVVK